MQFTTAETGYAVPTMDTFVEKHFSNPPETPPLGPHPREVSTEATAQAIVRQSRWVVLCPWCPSAQYAHTRDRRFFCIDCANGASGKWIAVEWPKDPDMIETLLAVRPDPTTRGWEWGEELDHLVAENLVGGPVE